MNLAHEAPIDPGRRVREGSPELTQRVVRPVMPQPEVRPMGPMPEHNPQEAAAIRAASDEIASLLAQGLDLDDIQKMKEDQEAEALGLQIVRGGVVKKSHRLIGGLEVGSLNPKNLLRTTSVDLYIKDNSDHTRDVYVDQHGPRNFAQAAIYTLMENIRGHEKGVYHEVYDRSGLKNDRFARWKKGKLIKRERIGEDAQLVWEITPSGKPNEKLVIRTERYLKTLAEAEKRQAELQQEALSRVNMGGTSYTPTKEEKTQEENLKKVIKSLFISVKDSPRQQVWYGIKAAALSSLFWLTFRSGSNLPNIIGNVTLEKGIIGFGYSLLAAAFLTSPKYFVKQITEHPVATLYSAIATGAFLVAPPVGIALYGLLFLNGLRPAAKQLIDVKKEFREFRAEHPELMSKNDAKAVFQQERMQKQITDKLQEFREREKGWFAELKRLNPTLPDALIDARMQAEYEKYLESLQDLQGAFMGINSAMSSSLLKTMPASFLAVNGVGLLFKSLSAVNPIFKLLDPFSTLIGSAIGSAYATTVRYRNLKVVKNKVAEEFPDLGLKKSS